MSQQGDHRDNPDKVFTDLEHVVEETVEPGSEPEPEPEPEDDEAG